MPEPTDTPLDRWWNADWNAEPTQFGGMGQPMPPLVAPEPRPEWCVVKGCRERWPCPFHAAPEPGADAAWATLGYELALKVGRSITGVNAVIAEHRPRIEAALARPTPALDVADSLRDMGEMLTMIRRAGFPDHRGDDECFCDTCWSYLVEDAR